MNDIALTLLLGVVAGVVDIIPMVIKKLSKYSIVSAFAQWVILSIIIKYSSVFGLTGWGNGLVVAVLSAVPIVILVAKDDKKSVGVILVTSALLGAIVGYIGGCI